MNAIYSFFAGILSFFSPCVLPVLPSYLVFIGDLSLDGSFHASNGKKRTLAYHTISFILGFSLVFVALGLAGSIFARLMSNYRFYFTILGGLVLVFFGLATLGFFNFSFLFRQIAMGLKHKPAGILGSFIVGIAFASGWSPCIGPALSSVVVLTFTTESMKEAVFLLSLYSLGLGIPFLISSLAIDTILRYLKKIGRFTKYAKFILGFLLIMMGLILIASPYFPLTQRLLKVPLFF